MILNMLLKMMMMIAMTLIFQLPTQASAAPAPLFFNLARGRSEDIDPSENIITFILYSLMQPKVH